MRLPDTMTQRVRTFKRTVRVVTCGAVVVLAGCSGGSPAAPTPSYPTVNGNYSGNITVVFPELKQSFACPATTVVTQTQASVNIAPMILSGGCGGLSIPFGPATIDINGALIGQSTSTFTDDSCGTYNMVASGGFFGKELRLSLVATSTTCWNFNFSAVLNR